MYKATFPQGNVEQKIGTNSIDQYPLLIGVRHDRHSEYSFTRLIDGTDKRPVVDEFLARLIQFKDQFDLGEEDFEKAKVNFFLNKKLFLISFLVNRKKQKNK
jgi:hypothetical protein